MERSLSVLLPVENAESTLAATVAEILEILPELTSRFELVIIDNGSGDATIEVADELALRYPQIHAVRNQEPLSRSEAIETGLDNSSGEVVFLQDENCHLAIDEIHKLWSAIDDHQLVAGRPDESWWSRWTHWMCRGQQAGFQMVHRRAIRQIRESIGAPAASGKMSGQGHKWHKVEVNQPAARRPSRLAAARTRRGSTGRKPPAGATHRPQPGSSRFARRNYLAKIKNFTLGE